MYGMLQKDLITELDDLLSRKETGLAIGQINLGKALGPDGIPIELFQKGEENIKSAVFNLINACWEGVLIP